MLPETLKDLKRIVAERLEETTRLEFKRILPESGKNDDLAKDLAAMANAEGGVIIYGVEEDGGRAKELAPFTVTGAPERVAWVASTLDEPLKLSNVFTITDRGKTEGFLIVEIPRSERAPHFYKGFAPVRTGRVITRLTRRQAGELFARSPGFAEEFGLRLSRPGQVRFTLNREGYQYSRSVFDRPAELHTDYVYFLVFENVGESDIFAVDWAWVSDSTSEGVGWVDMRDNPFPVDVMHPGAKVSVRVEPLTPMGATLGRLKVRTVWKDASDQQFEREWPVSW